MSNPGDAKRQKAVQRRNHALMQALLKKENFDGVPDSGERANIRARFEISRVNKKHKQD